MSMEKITCIRVLADEVQIKNCRSRIKAKQDIFTGLGRILELAGNEVRLKILYLLEEEKELCPCDLSDILEMTIPAVSQHLRKLKDGNIIQSKKIGQTIFYSLKQEHLKILKPFFKYININEGKEEKV
jgi:ArsR family transcriptional regulator, lead/cadmium/zinc/bismuth-responsive transcriptional repressor